MDNCNAKRRERKVHTEQKKVGSADRKEVRMNHEVMNLVVPLEYFRSPFEQTTRGKQFAFESQNEEE
jgi:hypothetical protein